MEWHLVVVDENTYLFSQWATLILGVIVAILAAMKYINHEVLMSLIKEDVIMTKDEFERVQNTLHDVQDNLIQLG